MFSTELANSFNGLKKEFSIALDAVKKDEIIMGTENGVTYYAPRWAGWFSLFLISMMILTAGILMLVAIPIEKVANALIWVIKKIHKIIQTTCTILVAIWLIPILLLANNNGLTKLGKFICRKEK